MGATVKVDLEALIASKYPLPEWAIFYELNKGVGWRGTEGRIDMAAINCWPSKHHTRVAFEMKRSRGDWLKELSNPTKRKWCEANFHETWFVVAHGVAKDVEVPEGWGLMIATKQADKLIKRIPARHREIDPLDEGLAIAAIRALSRRLQNVEGKHYYFEGSIIEQRHVDALVEGHIIKRLKAERSILEQQQNAVVEMQEDVDAFRKEYTAPLMKLASLIDAWTRHHFKQSRRNYRIGRPDLTRVSITVEDVEEWFEQVKRDAIKSVLVDAQKAHDSLAGLLRLAGEHNLKPKVKG